MAFAARYEIALPADDERRGARRRVRLDASASDAKGASGPLLIHDLSAGGFLAAVDGPPPESDRISVDLPGLGPVPARIAWRGERCFGGEFVAPLGHADLALVMGKARVVWADFAESKGKVADLTARAERLAEPRWDDTAPPPAAAEPSAPDDRYPVHMRLRIIAAAALLAWLPFALLLCLLLA